MHINGTLRNTDQSIKVQKKFENNGKHEVAEGIQQPF